MAIPNNEEDVKEVDVDVEETETDTEEETETPSLSSDDENEEEQDVEEDETFEEEETETTPNPIVEEEPLEGETIREYALRKELENTRKLIRQQKQEDLFIKTNSSQDEDDLLSQYDPDEVSRLEKIISKLGYVKDNDLKARTYESTANDEFNNFINAHPEYLAENDKDGVLWNTFKSEFAMYKQPESPKEYKKIFERIHNGLKSSSAIDFKKVNASREKLKVASHTGAANLGKSPVRKSQNTSGLRTDMLKGFDDDEINDILS